MSELPKCPMYVAHPQAVWFEVHWRPAYDALKAENERLKAELEQRDITIQTLKIVARAKQLLGAKL